MAKFKHKEKNIIMYVSGVTIKIRNNSYFTENQNIVDILEAHPDFVRIDKVTPVEDKKNVKSRKGVE